MSPSQAIDYVCANGLSYLDRRALKELSETALEVEKRGLEGVWVETGCALGGSAIVLAACKSAERPFHIYDTFELIHPPADLDGKKAQRRYAEIASGKSKGIKGVYHGYRPQLQQEVMETFQRLGLMAGVQFVRGRFEQTLDISFPVALAHVDCDWHDSVQLCLERITSKLVPGGRLVIDDYHTWDGCRLAVDAFFRNRTEFRFHRRARLHITRETSALKGTAAPMRAEESRENARARAGHP